MNSFWVSNPLIVLLALSLLCISHVSSELAADHEITDLPGLNHTTINFKQYSGYITVNETNGRSLFYWFVESQNSPANDPLVIWLNGGPGCSSLTGLLSENGPFIADADGKALSLNDFAWNRVANVIYLESPSGVGFSYSKTTSDYSVGDKRTADDSVAFLLQFFKLYPAFASSQVWITGESYGGHYVPNFARAIVEHNKHSKDINFGGFMAGNPWTDAKLDNEGAVADWYHHALISKSSYDGVMKNCDFSNIGPLYLSTEDCDKYLQKASDEMGRGHISIYQIYANVCIKAISDFAPMIMAVSDDGSRVVPTVDGQRLVHALSEARTPFSRIASQLKRGSANMLGDGSDPCIGNYVLSYLNRVDVQKAIHIEGTLPYEWDQCSPVVHYSRDDLLTSMLPVYDEFMKLNAGSEKVRILIFSGDLDGIVPSSGTRLWLEALEKDYGLKVAKEWEPWLVDQQVGGYVTHYSHDITFTTVRGAGHLVPGFQPGRAFYMFSKFLSNDF